MEQRDLIAAIATAAGTAAVGIVRLSGSGLQRLFGPLLGRAALQPRIATLCRFRDAGSEVLDEGLALYFPGPASYTGEDVLELQGHGGQAVLESVLARCLELGARPAQPGEFTYRAYLNGRMDLAQAEAVADLIEAKSAAAARSALHALSGDFSERVNAIAQAIAKLRVQAEAYLDFPEDDVDFFSMVEAEAPLQSIRSQLRTLKRSAQRGQLLRGARVVLAGPPNVGKSSLLNRLAQEDIAIVTATPGTTRDVVRATIQLHGVSIELLDTAGLRTSLDPIEQLGMERTRASLECADLALAVEDASAPEPDPLLMPDLGCPAIRVLNKVDLCHEVQSDPIAQGVYVSAVTGEGLEELREAIASHLGLRELQEGAFLARARHLRQLDLSLQHIDACFGCLDVVLLAEELRMAQQALGEIVGQTTAEELLGQIFAEFCIGK
ncbi:MAG: tRNA uridine-5-carboxymethylaminomethyl(34) synthesis GTPase MnmE [Burkholderiales bacterium]|nr:tRNA uridine-5-carboxymethylaminomethyl(34) synthesis GTPase MnmE [Burkholderiales bacterium]